MFLLDAKWLYKRRLEICRHLWGTITIQQQDHRDVANLNIKDTNCRHHYLICCSLPLPHTPDAWRAFTELWAR